MHFFLYVRNRISCLRNTGVSVAFAYLKKIHPHKPKLLTLCGEEHLNCENVEINDDTGI